PTRGEPWQRASWRRCGAAEAPRVGPRPDGRASDPTAFVRPSRCALSWARWKPPVGGEVGFGCRGGAGADAWQERGWYQRPRDPSQRASGRGRDRFGTPALAGGIDGEKVGRRHRIPVVRMAEDQMERRHGPGHPGEAHDREADQKPQAAPALDDRSHRNLRSRLYGRASGAIGSRDKPTGYTPAS